MKGVRWRKALHWRAAAAHAAIIIASAILVAAIADRSVMTCPASKPAPSWYVQQNARGSSALSWAPPYIWAVGGGNDRWQYPDLQLAADETLTDYLPVHTAAVVVCMIQNGGYLGF